MSSHEAAILGWYLGCYLTFIFVILPPVLFIRPLIDRHAGRVAEFSILTCVLGLFTWLIVAPGMMFLVAHFLIYGPLPHTG